MRSIWHKIKSIFVKKYKDETAEAFKKEKLIYTGHEPECWACGEPIHQTHRSRRLNGNKIHSKCFKRLTKIMMKGGKLDSF